MAFNLGVEGLKRFKDTLSSVQAGEYQEAAKCMLDSKWASQVKGRAVRLANMMRTGEV
jgi:lysozyme